MNDARAATNTSDAADNVIRISTTTNDIVIDVYVIVKINAIVIHYITSESFA